MKIIDSFHEIPPKAGDATLMPRAHHSLMQVAERKENEIYFPGNILSRFYFLKKGEQFLMTYPRNDRSGGSHLFFGGTDEKPFLVELEFSAFEDLVKGEDAFFQGLKSPVTCEWEGYLGKKAKRQGDWFAIGTTRNFQSWPKFMSEHFYGEEFAIESVESQPLNNTRHRLVGLYAHATREKQSRWSGEFIIAEGEIHAPDHEPLALKGPHLLFQADHLLHPQQAD